MSRFRTVLLLCAVFLFTSVGAGCVVLPGSSSHHSRSRCKRGKVLVRHKGKSKCKKPKHRKHKKQKKQKKHKKDKH